MGSIELLRLILILILIVCHIIGFFSPINNNIHNSICLLSHILNLFEWFCQAYNGGILAGVPRNVRINQNAQDEEIDDASQSYTKNKK